MINSVHPGLKKLAFLFVFGAFDEISKERWGNVLPLTNQFKRLHFMFIDGSIGTDQQMRQMKEGGMTGLIHGLNIQCAHGLQSGIYRSIW